MATVKLSRKELLAQANKDVVDNAGIQFIFLSLFSYNNQ